MFKMLNLAKVVNSLVIYGRPLNVAIKDVVVSYGLNKAETIQLIRLVR